MKLKYKDDITIIYLTTGRINPKFAERVRDQLLKISLDTPIISMSWEPLDFGQNIPTGVPDKPSARNIYRQILAGAKAAKTKYIGIAEDDVLYSPDHFYIFRPEDGVFAYNVCRWGIFTWSNPPIFSFTRRPGNFALIARREDVIKALEARYERWPDDNDYPVKKWGEIGRYNGALDSGDYEFIEYWSGYPNIVFTHEDSMGHAKNGKIKRLGRMKATEIPYWGRAEDIIKLWSDK